MSKKSITRKKLFFMDLAFAVGGFSLFGVLRPDYVVVAAFFLMIPYLFYTGRKILFYHLLLSFLMAILWVVFADSLYEYNFNFINIMGLELYPLFSWSVGLFVVYLLYRQHRYFPEYWGFVRHFVLFNFLYLILLITVETVAYHYFGIKIISASYPGLPVCDCIHAPLWVKSVYLMFGSVYFSVAYLFGLEKGHIKVFWSKR